MSIGLTPAAWANSALTAFPINVHTADCTPASTLISDNAPSSFSRHENELIIVFDNAIAAVRGAALPTARKQKPRPGS